MPDNTDRDNLAIQTVRDFFNKQATPGGYLHTIQATIANGLLQDGLLLDMENQAHQHDNGQA